MVANSGKTSSPGPIRALNLPTLLAVEEDHLQRPLAMFMGSRKLRISSVEDVWELVDEWWRKAPIVRRYYMVMLENGPCIILFRDFVSGHWYRQGV